MVQSSSAGRQSTLKAENDPGPCVCHCSGRAVLPVGWRRHCLFQAAAHNRDQETPARPGQRDQAGHRQKGRQRFGHHAAWTTPGGSGRRPPTARPAPRRGASIPTSVPRATRGRRLLRRERRATAHGRAAVIAQRHARGQQQRIQRRPVGRRYIAQPRACRARQGFPPAAGSRPCRLPAHAASSNSAPPRINRKQEKNEKKPHETSREQSTKDAENTGCAGWFGFCFVLIFFAPCLPSSRFRCVPLSLSLTDLHCCSE